jgi:predicted Zn-dependent protease with MMP-like domain/Tfp pilus assembly protein PilF
MTDEDANRDPDLEQVETIFDALDGENPLEALELARRAMAEGGDDDPVLHFLAGVASLELDRTDDALKLLGKACQLDPDDAEFRARLSEAMFRAGRFEDAAREARTAVAADAGLPHAHWALGLALEYTAGPDEADKAYAAAVKLAPEDFLPPVRVERSRFEEHLQRTMDALPERFREHLDAIAVTVEELPSEEILRAEQPPLDPELLGLFVGTPRTEDSVFGAGDLPARILLFQRNLERYALDEDELLDEIAVTLRHELGHYLGLDEEEIEEAGHA